MISSSARNPLHGRHRALVIGAHGFSARHLIRRLTEVEGAEVIAVDIPADAPDSANIAAYVSRDIGDESAVNLLMESARPDWVFNLAGVTGGSSTAVYRSNLLGPIHILDAVRAHAPDAGVLLVGSAAEYGTVGPDLLPLTEDALCRPVGDYGISKHAMTLAALDIAARHRLKIVVARPFNLVGPGIPASLVVGAILDRAKKALEGPGEPVVKVGNLDTQRDFVDVEDAVDAYVRMIKGDFWGQVFNICSGKPALIRDVVETLLSHSPRPIRLEVDPALVRPSDNPVVYGSHEKAKLAFDFEPTISLADSLTHAWDYAIP